MQEGFCNGFVLLTFRSIHIGLDVCFLHRPKIDVASRMEHVRQDDPEDDGDGRDDLEVDDRLCPEAAERLSIPGACHTDDESGDDDRNDDHFNQTKEKIPQRLEIRSNTRVIKPDDPDKDTQDQPDEDLGG